MVATAALGALVLVGVPSAGLALNSAKEDGVSLSATGSFASFTPATVDPAIARLVAERSSGKARMMRFTPAGVAARGTRSVTVAVRVDENVARAISVRTAIDAAKEMASPAPGVRITPTRYNLGVSRGYQSFARQTTPAPSIADAGMPDLADFRPSPGVAEQPSRFAARIALDEERKAGVAPRTMQAPGDQSVDLAGSYRLTRNLDVTAGVRYSQDRDRLVPLPSAQQDNQAVYIGTQFRF